ncbi:hypothetical protein MC885_010827 [Smutsia gigantea]|nr:hypothetical protein MC885_010827 [Smutsia gigantea]
MTRELLFSVAKLIKCCDLAKVLPQEDLHGFEGCSVSDCPLKAAFAFDPAKCSSLGFAVLGKLMGLCLDFVGSNFNIPKVYENTDGSFDYGVFQLNSHDWCNDPGVTRKAFAAGNAQVLWGGRGEGEDQALLTGLPSPQSLGIPPRGLTQGIPGIRSLSRASDY